MKFKDLEKDLIKFKKPARYVGNELGIPNKDFKNSNVKFVIAYPDIYEIGMSNLGIKIIYDKINSIEFASCERVFSPWIDFSDYLKNNDIPLYSLESKTPINKFDIFGISIQFELLFTNFLELLTLSKLKYLRDERKNNDPIVLCGGPGILNPEPFKPFADLFYIGEFEEQVYNFISLYNELKIKNYNKKDIIKELSKLPGFYSPEYSKGIIQRQVYSSFINDNGLDNYIIPSIDIVQDKHVVEIMRGCPNKCRFCQAGIIYKPVREKNIDDIFKLVDKGITNLGVDEVTFSSLSSGDYSNIIDLTDCFNTIYANRKISFSLPSIKVESFNPELLKSISHVRKSGLTFAIESGNTKGQYAINKKIELEKIEKIIQYAVNKGWRLIKLYFMIGLPDQENEIDSIINFIDNILKINKRLWINVNIAVFVPKPHTPYQYEKQMSLAESINHFDFISRYYKKTRVKIKKHNPYMSYLEGLIARGDEKIGMVFLNAYKNGARFDAWDDVFDYKIYDKVLLEYDIENLNYLHNKDYNSPMVWDHINVGVNKEFYINEINKSKKGKLSKSCITTCDKNCNICSNTASQIISKKIDKEVIIKNYYKDISNDDNNRIRYFLEFNKTGLQKFISHKNLIVYFQKLFSRSNLNIIFTEGFNPRPKFQFSSALELGIESKCEILEFFTKTDYSENDIFEILKKHQHSDISINRIKKINKKEKISFDKEVSFYIYYLYFKTDDFDHIEKIYLNFKSKSNCFSITKRNIEIKGKYQDYIIFNKLYKNKLEIKIININNKPKLSNTVIDIFGNNDLRIVKEKIFTIKNNKNIELFDIYN